MVQILLLKNPLFKQGLTLAQRLCYLSSSMFWLFPLSRMAFIFAPMFFIFFGMKIYIANDQEFIAYTLTYMLAGLLIQSYIFGRMRWPWVSDLYEYVQSVVLCWAVVSVFIHPRRPKFNVTAKGQTLDDDHLSAIAGPYFAIFGLVLASVVVLGFRYVNEPNARGLLTVVGLWSALNLCLSGAALGAVSERRERRSGPRIPTTAKANLLLGGEIIPVIIEEMSFGGLRVKPQRTAPLPARATAVLRVETAQGDRALEASVISAGRRVRDDSRSIGLRFYDNSGDRFRIIAQVMFSDLSPLYANRVPRYKTIGVMEGSLTFLVLSVSQTLRGVYYGLFRRSHAGGPPVVRSPQRTIEQYAARLEWNPHV